MGCRTAKRRRRCVDQKICLELAALNILYECELLFYLVDNLFPSPSNIFFDSVDPSQVLVRLRDDLRALQRQKTAPASNSVSIFQVREVFPLNTVQFSLTRYVRLTSLATAFLQEIRYVHCCPRISITHKNFSRNGLLPFASGCPHLQVCRVSLAHQLTGV